MFFLLIFHPIFRSRWNNYLHALFITTRHFPLKYLNFLVWTVAKHLYRRTYLVAVVNNFCILRCFKYDLCVYFTLFMGTSVYFCLWVNVAIGLLLLQLILSRIFLFLINWPYLQNKTDVSHYGSYTLMKDRVTTRL